MEQKQSNDVNRFHYIKDPVALALTQGLEKCMHTAAFDSIKTSDILEASGVSRSTFYRHYRDKYDMVNRNYQVLLDETLGSIENGMTFSQSFRAIYRVLRSNPEFYHNALTSMEPDGLRQYIYQQSYHNHVHLLTQSGIDMKSTYNRMLLTGYLSGALTITAIWAENGMKEDETTILQLVYDLMPDSFRKCFFIHFA